MRIYEKQLRSSARTYRNSLYVKASAEVLTELTKLESCMCTLTPMHPIVLFGDFQWLLDDEHYHHDLHEDR